MLKCNTLLALLAMASSGVALANHNPQHIETRHGSVHMPEQAIAVEGGFTAVLQTSDDANVDEEVLGSFDLVTTLPVGRDKWVVYVEGNTSPRDTGVSNLLREANADAGSALDRDGNGRLQVSELHYFHPLKESLLVAGLLDVTASFDGSDVANDETAQFLSGPLVNNATIEFPDYSLGVVYSHELGADSGYSLTLTSSHGLGDNPDASYAQLIDVSDDGKGVFAAAEGQWPIAGSLMRVGAWVNSADHVRLDGGGSTDKNYGVYLSVDGKMLAGQWNIRAGLANEQVSQASQFLSVAMEQPLSQAALGVGIAYIGLSGKDTTPKLDDTLLMEAYLRFERGDVNVTPALKWISNSGFDASGSTFSSDQLLLSLRLNYTF